MDFLKWKREKRERDTERQGRREAEKVGIENFELLKVLGTGGKS